MKNKKKFVAYTVASLASTIIDLIIFTFISGVFFVEVSVYSLFMATAVARILATLFNYVVSKKLVFKSNIRTIKSLIKYYSLALAKMLASWIFVFIFYKIFSFNETVVKIPVDIILFFIGYVLQKKWVFKD